MKISHRLLTLWFIINKDLTYLKGNLGFIESELGKFEDALNNFHNSLKI